MIRRVTPWAALFFAACGGDGGVNLTVNLGLPAKEILSPLTPGARLARIRLALDGDERNDETSADLALGTTSATFEGYPVERGVVISAEGFDTQGNLVAYGRGSAEVAGEDLTVEVPFRRVLAYVTHRAPCDSCSVEQACVDIGQGFECRAMAGSCDPACGAGFACVEAPGQQVCERINDRTSLGPRTLYAIDLNTRALVDKIPLPGVDPRGRGVSAVGGDGVLVAFRDGTTGKIGLLSSSDHTFTKVVESMRVHDLAVAAPGYRYAVAAGGGGYSVIDLEQGAVVATGNLGGQVQEAVAGERGRKALFATRGGLALFDLADPTKAAPISPGEVNSPGGVALSDDGRIAYITSTQDRRLFSLDLRDGGMSPLCQGAGGQCSEDEGFRSFVGPVVFSERIKRVLAIQAGDNAQRVLIYDVIGLTPEDQTIGTLTRPSDLAIGPGGRRLMVLASGTSSSGAGLTTIDCDPTGIDGSTVAYLRDPDDVYFLSGSVFRQRYQPFHLAILNGQ